MDFRQNRENESWHKKIWNYLKSFFQREETPSIIETWERIRPTPTTSEASSIELSSAAEEPRQGNRRLRKNQPKFLVCNKLILCSIVKEF